MEFLVLFLLVLTHKTCAQTNSSNQTSTLLPAKCLPLCGNISIPYPFGVGAVNCFRTGFELTCNRSVGLLSLDVTNETSYQIKSFDSLAIHADTSITVIHSNINNYNISWTAPKNGPYSLTSYNTLKVIGCGINVNFSDGKEILDQCWTICDSKESVEAASGTSCHSTGCCQIAIPHRLTSYVIQLTRVEFLNRLGKDYEIKVFISSDEYIFMQDDLYTSNRFNASTRMNITLNWNIPGTCVNAKKRNSYACKANNSYCTDDSTSSGYHCSCPWGDYSQSRSPSFQGRGNDSHFRSNATNGVQVSVGNAYLAEGCEGIISQNIIQPNSDCRTKCGNIDILFPFGLEKGCDRNPNFALSCNTTAKSPTLLFNYYSEINETYLVDEILIEEAQLRVNTTNATIVARPKDLKPFFFYSESGLFNWVIDYTNCSQAKSNTSTYACVSDNSSCQTKNLTDSSQGYHCICVPGYEGNPYLSKGCTDINECSQPGKYFCNGSCFNTVGSYLCCPPGTVPDTTNHRCNVATKRNVAVGIYIGVGLGIGFVCLIAGVSLVFCRRIWHQNIQKKMRQKYFYQNRGRLLQQLISCNEDIAEKTKIFQLEELEKATSNFDQSRIVGRGGHGTVFKGLLSDQRVVAIKKSQLTMKKEIDQFINEVVILSRINHRNIVKLFGCCLEAEVPLLVCEFISNGTLHDHLHTKDLESTLSWADRLRIASETAGALSYLHSAASISIFHRDVKSANILLDEYLTAKVSDFGASRSIPIDQTQITTAVQGTFGYLDPEYYHTSHLTEKSDVYSFGVILVELLTGELPISFTRDEEERNLSMHFLRAIKENSIFDLVEARIKEEGTTDELGEFIDLAANCLRLSGEERPTMKEIEFKLQSLRIDRKQQKGSKQVHDSLSGETPIFQDEIFISNEEHMLSTSDKQSVSSLTQQV